MENDEDAIIMHLDDGVSTIEDALIMVKEDADLYIGEVEQEEKTSKKK